MSKQAINTETALLLESDLISLALIAVEVGESVDRIAHRFSETVVLDDVGMRSISAAAAREFFTERAEWKARHDEEARRRSEELGKKHPKPPAGVPAVEGADTGMEALMASGDYVTPSQEFGLPRPNFLEEELAAGRRAAAEKQALVKKMKDEIQ